MNRLDHERLTQLFAAAAELPTSQRAGFLDSTCPNEPELRRELDELLACSEPASAVFDAASAQIMQPDPEQIGPYTILEPIGEGGMAIVYKAQQQHPVRRIVAVKLIKLGMDTRQFVERFEAERQALAMMNHPNVARVFDAGSTDTGRPYFVMEHVPGRPILRYCDEKGMALRERLELFISVCDAVEHAHRKGILHRDLKNSNVLVTEVDGKPTAKVIDFGVAKALEQPFTERALVTEQGQFIGTPECMSPEQAERGALDVDTRSDVYSLGVLLYELIAGVQPIASDVLRNAGLDRVMRVLREADTPRPSTRLSALTADAGMRVARGRRLPLPRLIHELRHELEWIPLKAMRKDREQRYQSAVEMGRDIGNYLNGRPLIAGPESKVYKVRKFVRRHRAGVTAVVIVALSLVAGIVATSLQTVRARRAEANARQAEAQALVERDNAKATVDFFTDDVLSNATPDNIPDAKVREEIVQALIAPAARRVGDSFKDRPVIEASVRAAIQTVYRDIGRAELALPHSEAALAIRRRDLGDDHVDTMQSMNDLGRVLRMLGRFADAEPLYREALDRRRRMLGEEHLDSLSSLNNYAGILERLGRFADAEPMFKRALELRRKSLGDDDPSTILSLNNYAHLMHMTGRVAESEPLYREALERRRRVQGDDHTMTLLAINNYADVLTRLGRFAESEPLYFEALERYRRVIGPDDPRTLTVINNHAYFLGQVGRHNEALLLHQQLLERRRRLLGEEHPDTLFSMSQYATALGTADRDAEAEPIAIQALELNRRLMGDSHPNTLKAACQYASLLLDLNRPAEAEPLLRSTAQRAASIHGPSDNLTLQLVALHANALLALGRAAEAEPIARVAVDRAVTSPSFGPANRFTKQFAEVHAKCLDALNRHIEAAEVRSRFELTGPSTAPAKPPIAR